MQSMNAPLLSDARDHMIYHIISHHMLTHRKHAPLPGAKSAIGKTFVEFGSASQHNSNANLCIGTKRSGQRDGDGEGPYSDVLLL